MTINDRKREREGGREREREREGPMKRRKKTLLDANNCSIQTRGYFGWFRLKKSEKKSETPVRKKSKFERMSWHRACRSKTF
jgi:hypothetical protein